MFITIVCNICRALIQVLAAYSQSRFWFKEEIRQGLLSMLDDEEVKGEMSALMNMVDNGEIYSSAAAQKILKKYTAKPR